MASRRNVTAHFERMAVRRELEPALHRLEELAAADPAVWDVLQEIDRALPGPLGSESIRPPRPAANALVAACDQMLVDHLQDQMLHTEYFHNNGHGRAVVNALARAKGISWREVELRAAMDAGKR